MKQILLARLLLGGVLVAALTGCTLWRGLKYLGPDVRDGDRFPARALTPAPSPDVLAKAERMLPLAGYPLRDSDDSISMRDYLAAVNTAGLLVVRGDSIVYEYYGEGYAEHEPVMAYSVTKSYIGTLVGIAVSEGLLAVADPVREHLPELDPEHWDGVTVEHVLQMTTGNAFREDQHPLRESARFYYGNKLRRRALRQTTDHAPGTTFRYKSGDTQLLTQILEAAIAPRTVTDYLQEKLWDPMGAQYAGTFNTDERGERGIEKGSCCLNATATEHAKLGMIYRDGGTWRGEQVVPEAWVAKTYAVDSTAGASPNYQYHWWLGGADSADGEPKLLAEGIINQFIYVDRARDLVIVKQSDGYGVWNKWTFMQSVAARVEAAQQQ